MKELQILASCHPFSHGCWSSSYQCFVGRREVVKYLATRVLGSRLLAERWLYDPAIGLGHQHPCRLIITRSGYEQVITLLKRIEMGIYV